MEQNSMNLTTAIDRLQTLSKQMEHAISTANEQYNTYKEHLLQPTIRRDLDGTTLTDKQERAAWYFDMLGVIGYVILLKEVAEEERTAAPEDREPWPEPQKRVTSKKRSLPDPEDDYEDYKSQEEKPEAIDPTQGHEIWHRLIEDLNLGSHSRSLYYLSSLPPELLRAWIHGNVPERMQDHTFAKKAYSSVLLRDIQGTYAVMPAVTAKCSSTQPSSSTQLHQGHGIKWSHLEEALLTMDKYTRVDNASDEEIETARGIDAIFLQKSLAIDYTSQRKYGRGPRKNDFEKIQWWIQRMQDESVDLIGPSLYNKNDYMKRCFAYAGLASNVRDRGLSHTTQRGEESKLLGLFMSVLRYKFEDYYDTQNSTFQIFRTTRIADIGLDEIISTELVSGHPWDGGLNFTWAGVSVGANAVRTHPDYLRQLQNSAESIRNSGFQDENIAQSISKLERIQKLLPIAMSYQREAGIKVKYWRQTIRTLQDIQKRVADKLEEIKNLQRLKDLQDLEDLFAAYCAA